ncbi:MAG: molybdopterin-guanine dinucleotide biosynthesis protein B, partial [Treponema sp.]|nr:molybdopterin-guanine dinucleotide biosynthesis protein B [Treponema sp.]
GILEEQIKAGCYSLLDVFRKIRVRYIPLRYTVFADEVVRGVNTPQEYAALLQQNRRPPIIAVCGVQNSGKTTLLVNIIPLLKKCGLRIAAVKHDGHDFEGDVPGTDSYRLRESGAYGVGIYSSRRYMINGERTDLSPDFFAPFFADADLILLEGGKHGAYPKIEVVRSAISRHPVNKGADLLAISSDIDHAVEGIPVLRLDDYEGIAALIIRHCAVL